MLPGNNNRITAAILGSQKAGNQEKVSCFFAPIFGIFKNRQYYAVQRGDREKSPLPFGKSADCPWRTSEKKFSQIPAYSGLCGFVRNRGKFPQITVIFALRGVVGSRGRNAAVKLAEAPSSPSRVSAKAHTAEAATFLEQDSTTVPNFANRSFCPAGILLGLPPQARLFAACAA